MRTASSAAHIVAGQLAHSIASARAHPWLASRFSQLFCHSPQSVPERLSIPLPVRASLRIVSIRINLAIQDAVAAANILSTKLRQGTVSVGDLEAVQRRRTFPTQATQRIQLIVQNNVIRRVLAATKPLLLPWFLKLLRRFPYLRRYPARVVAVGFRPEHIRTAAQQRAD
jgi:hypothetical protein